MTDRAVSTALGYALTLSIATLLVTGLLFAGSGYVEDQRDKAIRSELRVVGEQVAADLAAVDQLAQASGTDRVVVQRSLPTRISGSSYTIEVVNGGDPHLVLMSTDPQQTVEIDLVLETGLAGATVSGGEVRIVYTGGNLEVHDG